MVNNIFCGHKAWFGVLAVVFFGGSVFGSVESHSQETVKNSIAHPEFRNNYERKVMAIEHPDIIEYDADSGRSLNYPGLRNYNEENKRQTHPSYPSLHRKTPDWMGASGDRWVSKDIFMQLLSNPVSPQDSFILRLSYPHTVKSCEQYGTIDYDKKILNDVYMEIRIFGISSNDDASKMNCHSSMKRPYVDISFNVDELENIKEIKFMSMYKTDIYKVMIAIDKSKIMLSRVSQSDYGVLPITDKRYNNANINPLEHYFYPENTVIVFPAISVHTQEQRSQIKEVARQTAELTPIEKIIKDFKPVSVNDNVLYFIDETGKTISKLRSLGNGQITKIGYISHKKTLKAYGKNIIQEDNIPVYARLPGEYE